MGTQVRYVLPKWLEPERVLCSLLFTRSPFNRFSHCEDIFIFMPIQYYLYLSIITFLLELSLFIHILCSFFGIACWYPSLADDDTLPWAPSDYSDKRKSFLVG